MIKQKKNGYEITCFIPFIDNSLIDKETLLLTPRAVEKLKEVVESEGWLLLQHMYLQLREDSVNKLLMQRVQPDVDCAKMVAAQQHDLGFLSGLGYLFYIQETIANNREGLENE